MSCKSLHNLCAECSAHLESIKYVIPEPFHKHPEGTAPVAFHTTGNFQRDKMVMGYVKLLTDIGTAVVKNIWGDSDEPGSIHVKLTERNGRVAAEPIEVMIDAPIHLAVDFERSPEKLTAILDDLPKLDGFEWNYEPSKSHANLSRLHWFDTKVKSRGEWQLCEIDIDAHKRYIGPGMLRFLRRTFHLLGYQIRVLRTRLLYHFTLIRHPLAALTGYVSSWRSPIFRWLLKPIFSRVAAVVYYAFACFISE